MLLLVCPTANKTKKTYFLGFYLGVLFQNIWTWDDLIAENALWGIAGDIWLYFFHAAKTPGAFLKLYEISLKRSNGTDNLV